MPGSLTGLLVAIVVLIPGYLRYALRKRIFSTRRLPRAMEAAGVIVVATVANTTVLVIYGLLRMLPFIREHSPSPSELIRDPAGYILLSDSRLAWVVAWIIGLLILASLLSAVFTIRPWPLKYLSRFLAPTIAETSGWYQVFMAGVPKDSSVAYVICELLDGSYVSGDLAWFNTDPEEGPDRDIVLAPPFSIHNADGNTFESPDADDLHRVVVSARDIRRIYVSYIADQQ